MINLGKTYDKLRIFPKIFCKSGPCCPAVGRWWPLLTAWLLSCRYSGNKCSTEFRDRLIMSQEDYLYTSLLWVLDVKGTASGGVI